MYENHKPLKINIISDIHYYSKETGVTGKAFEKENAKTPLNFFVFPSIKHFIFQQFHNWI